MSIEENKAIVRRHVTDVIEQGHVELLDGYHAPDGAFPTMKTIQEWKSAVAWEHRVAPGFKAGIVDMVAEGDKVWCCVRFEWFLQAAPFLETGPWPALGQTVSWSDIMFIQFVNGKMAVTLEVSDMTDAMVNGGAYTMTKPEAV